VTTPITATPTEYAVTLHIEGVPPQPMRYSRVKGRKFQPDEVVLTYQQPWSGTGTDSWRTTALLAGRICRKDDTPTTQWTTTTFMQSEFPDWLTVLADEHRPAGAA
jgi:hypothetical protein